MQYGLSDEDIRKINGVFSAFPWVEKVVLYGSRAMGTQHTGSDIDLVMFADRMKLSDLNSVNTALDELYLPYTFDLSFFHHIENADLLQHIARVGKVFYQRSSEGK